MALALVLSCALLPLAVHADGLVADPDEGDAERAMLEFHREYTAGVMQALAAGTGPRGLAYAAMLDDRDRAWRRLAVPGPEATGWRARALKQAGEDTVALSLLAAATHAPTGAEAAMRWRELEPDNLVPLLYAGLAPDDLRAAAARATTGRTHTIEQLRWHVDAVRRVPPDVAIRAVREGADAGLPDALAVVEGWATLSGASLPLQPLMQACSGAGARGGVVADECARIAQTLQAADTRLLEGIGYRLAIESAGDPVAHERAQVERRRFDWQMSELGRWSAGRADEGLDSHIALLLDPALDSEGAIHRAQLREAGIPLDPPADWRSR
ncbi:hypothetical protein CO641_11610 [Lysobacteraceae bacterium NML91-0213]|nr:hypothetical protein CO641_11610 [Xanthomonadaceae bacterium NML91-0213]